jgi:hypothetical protein
MRLFAWCGTSHAISSAAKIVTLHYFGSNIGHIGYSKFKYRLALLVCVVFFSGNGFVRCRVY